MRYFDLSDDVTIRGRWHLSAIRAPDRSEPRLGIARHCEYDALHTEISHSGRALDFCLTSFAIPVASRGLSAAIRGVGKGDVQCIPLSIPGHQGFEVLNVLRQIECLDEHRSEFLKWTDKDHRADKAGQYRMVARLRVRQDMIPRDAQLFRISGWRIALIVSETVKSTMEAAGCLGARFIEVT